MQLLKNLFNSKKFVVALVTVVASLAAHWGWDVKLMDALKALAPFLVYIGAQGFADFGKEINKK